VGSYKITDSNRDPLQGFELGGDNITILVVEFNHSLGLRYTYSLIIIR
jgi:hypothetical protein